MKGLINFPKPADVDFAASLSVVLTIAATMLYVLATGFSGVA